MFGRLREFISGRNELRLPGVPLMALWQRELARESGAEVAAELMERARARYGELYSRRQAYPLRALRMHLERLILPGLALYQTLREDGQDQQAAVKSVERLMVASLQPRRKQLETLGRLPFFFALVRMFTGWPMRLTFPREGWDIEQVEQGPGCVAFDIHRCFYLDVLTGYGAPELTPVYCLGDDVLFEDVSPYLRWQRDKTQGRGNDCCDFRFYRATPEKGRADSGRALPG